MKYSKITIRNRTAFMALTAFIIIFVALISLRLCTFHDIGSTENRNKLTVSILPLKYLIDEITGGDFETDIIVPPGASPETYELNPQQIIKLNDSRMIFLTGLIDFESGLVGRMIQNGADRKKIVDLSRGIELIEGECSHTGRGGHGVDPHIWLSPKQLVKMTENTRDALMYLFPDSVKYRINSERLIDAINAADRYVASKIEESNIKHFVIYHPALTYYANDYGLIQLSIESEGKEPSADKLRNIIELARKEKIRKILYQHEFNKSVVKTVAGDIGATIVEINPLAENVIANILSITDILTSDTGR